MSQSFKTARAKTGIVIVHELVTAGGQERTQAQYEVLLHDAGLRRLRTTATASDLGLIEAASD
ncbi:MAG TPA: hypothetical protein VLJ62_22395 [Burkholderiaceae bacterium]|nr:hypothetical protein [Burkholderiaceae bacterium]